MANEIKALSVQQLVDTERGPVFVINTSSKAGIGRGGDVFITMEIGKSSRTLKVPRTWIPIELTNLVPRKSLTESPHFLEAIAKNLIAPISEEDARKLMKRGGYDEEKSRLDEADAKVREAGMAKGIGKNVNVTNGHEDEEEENAEPSKTAVKRKNVSVVSLADPDGEDDEESSVSAGFQAWVSKLNHLGDAKLARNEIRNRGELEEEEAHYMMENIKYPKIKASLAKALGRDE